MTVLYRVIFLLLSMISSVNAKPNLTVWRFEGELAHQLQRYVQQRYQDHLNGHIFDEESLVSQLNEVKTSQLLTPSVLKCFLDREICDYNALTLKLVDADARMTAKATPKGNHYEVSLTWERIGEDVKQYRAVDDTLAGASERALASAFSIGKISIEDIPMQSSIFLNGQEVRTGPGSFPVKAGTHLIEVKADQFQPYSQELKVEQNQHIKLKINMVSSLNDFTIKIEQDPYMLPMKNLIVRLDGKMISHNQPHKIESGMHHVEVSAKDRSTYSKDIELLPGQVAELSVALRYNRPLWKILLAEPDPTLSDRLAQFYLRAQLGSARPGSWRAELSNLNESKSTFPQDIDRQAYSSSISGIDIGFSYAFGPKSSVTGLRIAPVGLSYQTIDSTTLSQDDSANQSNPSSIGVQLDHLDRWATRFLWFGYQLSFWKITSYLQLGPTWVLETGQVSSGFSSGRVSKQELRLGWEGGVDVQVTPLWAIKTGFTVDTRSDSRSVYTLNIGAGYAFSLPF